MDHGNTGPEATILLVDDTPAKLPSYEVMLGGLGARLLKAELADTGFRYRCGVDCYGRPHADHERVRVRQKRFAAIRVLRKLPSFSFRRLLIPNCTNCRAFQNGGGHRRMSSQ